MGTVSSYQCDITGVELGQSAITIPCQLTLLTVPSSQQSHRLKKMGIVLCFNGRNLHWCTGLARGEGDRPIVFGKMRKYSCDWPYSFSCECVGPWVGELHNVGFCVSVNRMMSSSQSVTLGRASHLEFGINDLTTPLFSARLPQEQKITMHTVLCFPGNLLHDCSCR